MVAAAILSTLLLFLAASAKPVEQRDTSLAAQLAFVKLVTVGNLVSQAQLRLDKIKGINNGPAKGINSPADNRAVSYIATVGVGSPPTNCKKLQRLMVRNF